MSSQQFPRSGAPPPGLGANPPTGPASGTAGLIAPAATSKRDGAGLCAAPAGGGGERWGPSGPLGSLSLRPSALLSSLQRAMRLSVTPRWLPGSSTWALVVLHRPVRRSKSPWWCGPTRRCRCWPRTTLCPLGPQ